MIDSMAAPDSKKIKQDKRANALRANLKRRKQKQSSENAKKPETTGETKS